MKTTRKEFIVPFAVACFALALTIVGIYYVHGTEVLRTGSLGTISRQPGKYSKAVSTNSDITIKRVGGMFGELTIAVHADGSGSIQYVGRESPDSYFSGTKQIPVGALDYTSLRNAIAAVPTLEFKSPSCLSLGVMDVTTQISYGGQTSPSLSCLPTEQRSSYENLWSVIAKVDDQTCSYLDHPLCGGK